MSKLQQLKKINFLSLIGLILVLSFLLTIPTYYIIYQNYKNEIENIKKEYIQTQKSLMQNQVNNDEKKLVEKMKKAGYILNSKVDEMKYLEYLSQLQKYKSKKMKLVIAPTLNCNFKCDYCFEKPIIGDMGIEVQNQIIEMIKKKISEDSIKDVLAQGSLSFKDEMESRA